MDNLTQIRQLDTNWDRTKIRTLIKGEALVTITDATGQQYTEMREGRTAYDMRCSAFDNGRIEDILEPIQLDIAIDAISKENGDAATALWMATRGYTEDEIDDAMALVSGKPARHLLDRGIELVRRYEGGRAVERQGSRVGSAVCWRCMEAPAEPGELCRDDCDGLTDRKRRQLAGLKRGATGTPTEPYDPTKRPDPSTMTNREIKDELHHLKRTAGLSLTEPTRGRNRNAPIPGGSEYTKQVVPYGTSPDEIEGVGWSPLA
jgi:hypothetical protein